MAWLSAILLVISLAAVFAAVYLLALRVSRGLPRDVCTAVKRLCVYMRHAVSKLLEIGPTGRILAEAHARKRTQELRAGMPEMLRALCMALDSGASLTAALEYASASCAEPLAGELKRAVWDLKAGQGFDEAMENLRERTGGSEFAYLAVAMEIQHRSGGSLTGVLSSVSDSLRKACDLEEELKTKTTQARASARVVAVMPILVLLVLTVFSPHYLAAFFSSALGLVLLLLAVALEALGILLVRRALDIDLGSTAAEVA